jgi:hypothetical protein
MASWEVGGELGMDVRKVGRKDGDGDPIPDSPRGIPLLGDGDGDLSSPTGMETVEFCSPSGLTGTGMGTHSPSPFPAGIPV